MITPNLITNIDKEFRGLKVDRGYKLIKANLDKIRTVEATYRFKSPEEKRDIEVSFCIPRHFIRQENPIADIGTLSKICYGLTLNDNYTMERLKISNEKIKAEYFNSFDSTTIKITFPKYNIME